MPPIALRAHDGFHHEALLYEGARGFLDATMPFIRDGLEADEPTLVVVDAAKIGMLRESLGADAASVQFADMAAVGANPARIIPAWRGFVSDHAGPGRRLRGIGEPIWPGRSDPELAECHRHESLLNLAFAGSGPFDLLCPYDTAALDPEVIDEARRTHPHIVERGAERASDTYRGLAAVAAPFSEPLDAPPQDAVVLWFDMETLHEVRELVGRHARELGVTGMKLEDLMVSVSEVATNSVCHAGGYGTLYVWPLTDTLICEVRDTGRIDDPLVGRGRPSEVQASGYGLWLANQMCDLVQVRSFEDGSTVRLHMRRA